MDGQKKNKLQSKVMIGLAAIVILLAGGLMGCGKDSSKEPSGSETVLNNDDDMAQTDMAETEQGTLNAESPAMKDADGNFTYEGYLAEHPEYSASSFNASCVDYVDRIEELLPYYNKNCSSNRSWVIANDSYGSSLVDEAKENPASIYSAAICFFMDFGGEPETQQWLAQMAEDPVKAYGDVDILVMRYTGEYLYAEETDPKVQWEDGLKKGDDVYFFHKEANDKVYVYYAKELSKKETESVLYSKAFEPDKDALSLRDRYIYSSDKYLDEYKEYATIARNYVFQNLEQVGGDGTTLQGMASDSELGDWCDCVCFALWRIDISAKRNEEAVGQYTLHYDNSVDNRACTFTYGDDEYCIYREKSNFVMCGNKYYYDDSPAAIDSPEPDQYFYSSKEFLRNYPVFIGILSMFRQSAFRPNGFEEDSPEARLQKIPLTESNKFGINGALLCALWRLNLEFNKEDLNCFQSYPGSYIVKNTVIIDGEVCEEVSSIESMEYVFVCGDDDFYVYMEDDFTPVICSNSFDFDEHYGDEDSAYNRAEVIRLTPDDLSASNEWARGIMEGDSRYAYQGHMHLASVIDQLSLEHAHVYEGAVYYLYRLCSQEGYDFYDFLTMQKKNRGENDFTYTTDAAEEINIAFRDSVSAPHANGMMDEVQETFTVIELKEDLIAFKRNGLEKESVPVSNYYR